VSFEAVFLLGYSGLLLLVALGLHRVGRVNPSPWTGRVLAGHRRRHPDGIVETVGWPHREQPRLHTGIAIVAAAASAALAVAGGWRHHGLAVEVILFAGATAAAAVVLWRLIRALRPTDGGP
jgi:hypothetical protein